MEPITADAIARRLKVPLAGVETLPVRGAESLDRAVAGQVTWVKRLDATSAASLARLRGVLLVHPEPADAEQRGWLDRASRHNALLASRAPRETFAELLAIYFAHEEARIPPGIDPSARVEPTARLGDGVTVGAFCYIGADVEIGDGTVLHPHVVVHSGTRIGRRCILDAHVVVGGRGFGYVRRTDGTLLHFPQIGRVRIEDDVEIQAGSMVVRPGLGTTRVGRGTKIDNLCHIGHNAQIGPDCVITACSEIGARVVVGARTWIGPNSCCLEDVEFGADSVVGIGSVVLRSVDAGETVAGAPAAPTRDLRRRGAALRRLLNEQS
jgi:UDP-3-O-[3-hydroxymyristoyl] glucosamine N-acyltransferase